MMAQVVRAAVSLLLWQRSRSPPQAPCCQPFYHLLVPLASIHAAQSFAGAGHRSLFPIPSSHRLLHFRSRGLRFRDKIAADPDSEGSEGESHSGKSRNKRKRDARRSVRWGMELASFTVPQIKRILRAASLEQDVFEALMLVKKLGRDVREGKRRQFNYIGKLLREANPDLLGALIQATKDGDQKIFQALSGSKEMVDEDEEVFYPSESEGEEEDSHRCTSLATKWYDGLVNKDITISNEVYSVEGVEFDRQVLRNLVRKVHSLEDRGNNIEEDENEETKNAARLAGAKRSLTRFLRSIAEQIPAEQNMIA
ncbi:hypothetical protein Dimus_004577 [Dionaea muscipula]